MKNRYKISEMAKIFNISRQTLIFYHKKNILVPYIVDEINGYRYYSNEQIWELFFLLTLKKAGFSLEEIKEFTELKNSDKSIEFLENKVDEIDLKIDELQKSKEKIQKKIKNMKEFSEEIGKKISFGKIEKINCYFLKMKNQIDEAEMAMNYEKLHQIAKKNGIEEVKYITITDISNIEKLSRDSIIPVKKIGIIVPNKILLEKSEELYIGDHFLMNFSDSYTSLVESYKNLKKYVINENFIPKNYVIEIAEEFSILTEKGVGGLFKVLIPIESKN